MRSNRTARRLWHVSTSWKILGEGLGVIHSLLSGCVRIQVSPHVLDLQFQIQLRALPGALSKKKKKTHSDQPRRHKCLITSFFQWSAGDDPPPSLPVKKPRTTGSVSPWMPCVPGSVQCRCFARAHSDCQHQSRGPPVSGQRWRSTCFRKAHIKTHNNKENNVGVKILNYRY